MWGCRPVFRIPTRKLLHSPFPNYGKETVSSLRRNAYASAGLPACFCRRTLLRSTCLLDRTFGRRTLAGTRLLSGVVRSDKVQRGWKGEGKLRLAS